MRWWGKVTRLVLPAARRELMLLRALWFAVRGRRDLADDESAIRYGQETRLMVWVVLVVDGGLVVLLHFVLPWPVVNAVLLVLGIAATGWLIAFLATFYVYPHAVGPRRLRLRFGAMRDVSVPMSAVDSVRLDRHTWATSQSAEIVEETLAMPISNSTNVLVTLNSPVTVALRRQPVQAVRRVAFSADDPRAAHQRITAVVRPPENGEPTP